MRPFSYLVLAACLAGCATDAELAAQKQREVEQMVRIYGPACEKLGYQSNTDRWRDCILGLNNSDNMWRYNYPITTSCFGQAGFTQCTTF